MNAKESARGRIKTASPRVLVAVAALLLGATAFADPHGGGGGGHFSGGSAHSGASHSAFSAHNVVSGSAHYAPRSFATSNYAVGATHESIGNYAYREASAYGYRSAWAGGYWAGSFWPAAYYDWAYPLFLGALPVAYATYWWGGVPYYYVNNVYYTYDPSQSDYVATDPPPVLSDSTEEAPVTLPGPVSASSPQSYVAPSDLSPSAPGAGLIAYPKNGQSVQQQATDKAQCHTWAKGQTGFDPTSAASAGAPPNARSDYTRAMAACLNARGYSVR